MKPACLPCRAHAQLAAVCALVLLVSCSGTLLPKPAQTPARHTLGDAAPTTPRRAMPIASGAPVLIVAQPRAAPGFDSRRLLYLRQPLELEAFAFHEWMEPPAQLLAPLMVRALQDGSGFRAVLQAPSAAAGGWLLETELTRLQQDFQAQPSQVHLSLRAVLLDGGTRQVIAWRVLEARVPATRDDPVAGVQAAQAAVQQVLKDLTVFCESERQRAPIKPVGAAGSAP